MVLNDNSRGATANNPDVPFLWHEPFTVHFILFSIMSTVYSLLMEVIHMYTLLFLKFPFHMLILCVLLYVCLLLCSDMVEKTHKCPVILEHRVFH